jgi:hypothetical protein
VVVGTGTLTPLCMADWERRSRLSLCPVLSYSRRSFIDIFAHIYRGVHFACFAHSSNLLLFNTRVSIINVDVYNVS